jgi:C-terminal processing protease CtpA/Prc
MRRIPNGNRRILRRTVPLVALMGVAVFAQVPKDKPPLDQASWSLFQRIFGMVLRDYVDPKAPQDVVLGALKGAASSAGPECAYIPPEEVPAYQAALAAPASLPLFITKDADFGQVISTYPDQDPSLKAGDALRFVGDRSTYDLTYPQVLEALRGKDGDKVRCIFLKQEAWQSYTVTLTRQLPPAPKHISLGDDGSALILPCLEPELPSAVARSIQISKGPVLVDLRGCASDDARLALRWLGALLGQGDSPPRKGPKGVIREPLSGQGLLAGRTVRALVDGTTGRAGEVVAAGLASAGMMLVGSPTLGWAVYSQDFPLENGGLLRLNTAYFLAPDGEPLNGHPIIPAIPLTLSSGVKPEEAYRQALRAKVPKAGDPTHAAAESRNGITKEDGTGRQDPGHAR